MKTMLTIAAIAAVIAPAGIALAAPAPASSPASVTVGGTAEGICQLPSTWAFQSGFNGGDGAQWSGTTWTIPSAQFAGPGGTAAPAASEFAIRVRGDGFCNTSHKITVRSVRGGLVQGLPGTAPTPAPTGFANRRTMAYEASWWSGSNLTPYGPRAAVTADAIGKSDTKTYTVSDTLAPPGARKFDVRMGLIRTGSSAPLVAGDYSDVVEVTIAPAS